MDLRRTLTVVLAILATACGGGDNSPTSSNCVNVAGTYNGSFNNSCGQHGTTTVVVAQAGCNISAAVTGQGTIAGTLSGSTGSFTLTFSPPCSGTATGTATVSSTAINGTYSGRATGAGCCDPISGSFTLTR